MKAIKTFFFENMFQLDLINLSPERLPSLRPKRDLTLGGVPKVSHTHSLLLEPLILVAPYTSLENICSHGSNHKAYQERAPRG